MPWIGVSRKDNNFRALFYSYAIGKRRIYRSSYPVPSDKTFRLFAYKKIENAQLLCDVINEAYNDDFEPLEVDQSVINDVKEYAKNGYMIGFDVAKKHINKKACMPTAYKEGEHEQTNGGTQ